MVRASASWVVVAFALTACSSIKNYELGLRGSRTLNMNEDNQPNPVQVRVLRLKGDAAAKAFADAPFDALWTKPGDVPGIALDGEVQSTYVDPDETLVPVQVLKVPPEVTHVGLLALFHRPQVGKDRVLLPRDEIGDAEVRLDGQAIAVGAPAPAPAPPAAAPRQN